MQLGEQIRDAMNSVHEKFHKFIMHIKGLINLSCFPSLKFVQRNIMDQGYLNT
jgi:hypothetical protein